MSSLPNMSTTSRPRTSCQIGASTLAFAVFACALTAQAQSAKPAPPAATAPDTASTSADPDRAGAYYHYMLAHEYEDMANTYGRPEYATRAIEEYKLALNADPTSKYLNNGLAELYFRTGHVRDAIMAAQEQIKKDPNNLDAHKLLGNIYLRPLGDGQQNGASEDVLKLAIAEYTKSSHLSRIMFRTACCWGSCTHSRMIRFTRKSSSRRRKRSIPVRRRRLLTWPVCIRNRATPRGRSRF